MGRQPLTARGEELVEDRLGVAHPAVRQARDQLDGAAGSAARSSASRMRRSFPSISGSASGRKSKRCTREMTAGRIWLLSVVQKMNRTCGGGSSRVFEEDVPALGDALDLVDDEDLRRQVRGRRVDAREELPDVVDAIVRGRIELDHVEGASLPDRGFARRAGVAGLAVGDVGAVDGLGHDAGEGRLAGAARPDEEVRVGRATRADRVAEGRDHRLLAHDLAEPLGAPAAIEGEVGRGRGFTRLLWGALRRSAVLWPGGGRRPGIDAAAAARLDPGLALLHSGLAVSTPVAGQSEVRPPAAAVEAALGGDWCCSVALCSSVVAWPPPPSSPPSPPPVLRGRWPPHRTPSRISRVRPRPLAATSPRRMAGEPGRGGRPDERSSCRRAPGDRPPRPTRRAFRLPPGAGDRAHRTLAVPGGEVPSNPRCLRTPLFESGTINHSDTSPRRRIAKPGPWGGWVAGRWAACAPAAVLPRGRRAVRRGGALRPPGARRRRRGGCRLMRSTRRGRAGLLASWTTEPAAPRDGIGRRVHQAVGVGCQHGPHAHRARLHGCEDRHAGKRTGPEALGGLAQGDDHRVGRRVVVGLDLLVPAGDEGVTQDRRSPRGRSPRSRAARASPRAAPMNSS